MEISIGSWLKHAWNALRNRDPTEVHIDVGQSYGHRPDRVRFTRGNERSVITSIYTRIALDVSSVAIKHVQLDKEGRYLHDRDSGLNNCLNLGANIDQTGRAFIQDLVMSMFDEGCVAGAPVDTDVDPETASFDVDSIRSGRIVTWYPLQVKVNIYNDQTGRRQDVIYNKRNIAIIENPFYAIVNEPNSVLKRLTRKLSLLDITDERAASGKLDLIIQLPYLVRGDAKKKQAEERLQSITDQLANSTHGIAYTDGTEKIVQLNRSVENNLIKHVEWLQQVLYSQLGITQSVLDGTADEQTMLNYFTRTIEPIVSAIVDEFKRKFLTKTARTQGQSILFFRDHFKFVPVGNIAEIADKFTRNEILTSNEMRQIIGIKPSSDPKADMLVNSNIAQPDNKPAKSSEEASADTEGVTDPERKENIQNG